MRNLDDLFTNLARSNFRRRFRLGEKEQAYLDARDMDTVMSHAADFIRTRLAPARPTNDGKQTPMRGHPAFIAQHATATCCRGCLAKWHGITKGEPLSDEQIAYVLSVIERWLEAASQPVAGGKE